MPERRSTRLLYPAGPIPTHATECGGMALRGRVARDTDVRGAELLFPDGWSAWGPEDSLITMPQRHRYNLRMFFSKDRQRDTNHAIGYQIEKFSEL